MAALRVAESEASGNTDTLSWTHTLGSGASLVVVSLTVDSGITVTGGGVTYGGVAMTQIAFSNNVGDGNAYIFYIEGRTTNETITANLSAKNQCGAGAIDYSGAATPDNGTTAETESATSSSITVTGSPGADDFVQDAVRSPGGAMTVGANQNDTTFGFNIAAGGERNGGSTQDGVDGGVMSWSQASAAAWAHAGCKIPASLGDDLVKVEDEVTDVVEGLVTSLELLRVEDEVEDVQEDVVKAKLIAKSEPEVVNVPEDANFTVGRIKIEDEQVTIPEDIVKTKLIAKAEPEVINLGEGIVKPLTLNKIEDEIQNIQEGIVKTKLILKVEDEVENIVEAVINVLGKIKVIDEVVNITENINKTKLITQITDEVENISAPGVTTLDLEIADGLDDVRHDSVAVVTGAFALTVGEQGGNNVDAGLRFPATGIPQGSLIQVAHIRFLPNATRSATVVNTTLGCHDVDDSPRITTLGEWATAEAAQGTLVDFDSIPTWTISVEEDSPSLVVPIQEIVNRAGFGGVIHFLWINDGSSINAFRTFHTADSASQAPILHVEYSTPVEGLAVRVLNRILDEVANVNEGVVPARVLNRVLDEIENINEQVNKTKLIAKIEDEVENINEALVKSLALLRIRDEVVNIVEQVNEHITFEGGVGEDLLKVIDEVVNAVEGKVTTLTLNRILNEPESIVEGLVRVRDQIRILAETVNIQELLVPSRVLVRIKDEITNIVEAINKTIASFKIEDEAVNIVEAVNKTSLLAKIITEAQNVVEVVVTSRVLVRIRDAWIEVHEVRIANRVIIRIQDAAVNIVEGIVKLVTDRTIGVAIGTPTIKPLPLGVPTIKGLAVATPGIKPRALGVVAIRAL